MDVPTTDIFHRNKEKVYNAIIATIIPKAKAFLCLYLLIWKGKPRRLTILGLVLVFLAIGRNLLPFLSTFPHL